MYAAGHAVPTKRSREVVALLSCRARALICGRNAAAMWSLPVATQDRRLEVLVARVDGGHNRDGVEVHRTADAEHLIPRYIDGIPVTNPAWTLLDISVALTPRQLERALDEALALSIVTLSDVAGVIERRPTGRGTRVLRQFVADRLAGGAGARTHPGAEEQLLSILRAGHVDGFEVNVRIGEFQVDFWFPRLRLAIEVDSFRWHSQRSSWARDRRKDTYLRERGVDLLRITSEAIDTEPMAVLARVIRRIAAREANLGRGSATDLPDDRDQ